MVSAVLRLSRHDSHERGPIPFLGRYFTTNHHSRQDDHRRFERGCHDGDYKPHRYSRGSRPHPRGQDRPKTLDPERDGRFRLFALWTS